MLLSEVTVVELYEDNNNEPSYFRLSKPANEVTLQDIRAWYGPSGLFFFKTLVSVQVCSSHCKRKMTASLGHSFQVRTLQYHCGQKIR